MPEEKSVSLIMSFAYDCICKEEIFNSYLAFVKNQSKKKRTVRTVIYFIFWTMFQKSNFLQQINN